MPGAYTVRPEAILRQPALTMPGNATGSEAACTALTGSQIRALCGLGTTDIPTFGGAILNGNLLLSPTNTYDIGNGTYDPRTVRAATSVLTPLVNNASAALTLGNSTYGVTVPGAMGVGGANTGGKQLEVNGTGDIYLRGTMPTVQFRVNSSNQAYTAYFSDKFRIGTFDGTWRESFIIEKSAPDNSLVIASTGATTFSGDISMSKTSAQGYIRAYATDGVKNAALYHNGSNTFLASSSGGLLLDAASGTVACYGAVNQTFSVYATSGDYIRISQNGTSGGILSTTSGGMNVNTVTGITNIVGTSAAGFLRVYDSAVSKYSQLTHDGTNGILSTSSGPLRLTSAGTGFEFRPAAGYIEQWTSGSDGQYNIYDTTGTKRLQLKFSTAYGAIPDAGYIVAPKLIIDVGNTANVMCLGGGASNDPGLKRGGINILSARRFDDLADSNFTCAGITASGAIQETYRTSSLDPTVSDIGSGKRQGWYNTTATEFRDWVNVGGTLYKSAAYT